MFTVYKLIAAKSCTQYKYWCMFGKIKNKVAGNLSNTECRNIRKFNLLKKLGRLLLQILPKKYLSNLWKGWIFDSGLFISLQLVYSHSTNRMNRAAQNIKTKISFHSWPSTINTQLFEPAGRSSDDHSLRALPPKKNQTGRTRVQVYLCKPRALTCGLCPCVME